MTSLRSLDWKEFKSTIKTLTLACLHKKVSTNIVGRRYNTACIQVYDPDGKIDDAIRIRRITKIIILLLDLNVSVRDIRVTPERVGFVALWGSLEMDWRGRVSVTLNNPTLCASFVKELLDRGLATYQITSSSPCIAK